MKPEKALTIATTVVGFLYLSAHAFTPRVRQEILERDNHECQHCGRSRSQGYHLQAAHYPDLHQSEPDTNPRHGRASCTECHIKEEILRGNIWGAKQLWINQTIRHYGWIRDNGLDEKLPFEEYIRLAREMVVEV